MSCRILARLRKHVDFVESVRLLDELGLPYEVHPAMGRGHPFLQIGSIRWRLASSPRPRMRKDNVRTGLMRRLRAAGLVE